MLSKNSILKENSAYRKSGTQDPQVGPYGGILRWDPKVGPYGGTLRWDARAAIHSCSSK